MKDSILLASASRVLVPLQFVFSIFLLLRGHNDPGGGFAAGLLVGGALSLAAIATSLERARGLLRVPPLSFAGAGLLIAIASAFLGPLLGDEFLTGEWTEVNFAGYKLALGSPLLFDVGVYLMVAGISTTILFGLMDVEAEGWNQ